MDQTCLAENLLPFTASLDLLVAILDDLRRDVSPDVVLLAAPLRRRRSARDGHRGARAVVDEVRGRGNARSTTARMQQTIISILGALGGVSIITGRHSREGALAMTSASLAESKFLGLDFRVVSELESFDCSGALLADVADDVRDGVGLVPKMAVSDVNDARGAEALAVSDTVNETRFHFWRHVVACLVVSVRARRGTGIVGCGILWCALLLRLLFLSDVLKIISFFIVAVLNVLSEFWALAEGSDNVLHVVSLSTDQTAEMKNHTLSLITLAENGGVGVLEGRKLLLVAFTLTLKFLSDLLLEDESFKCIVTLLLGPREAGSKAGCIILLLVNEACEASVLTLVILDLNLEVLSLLRELFGESLEFEELRNISKGN